MCLSARNENLLWLRFEKQNEQFHWLAVVCKICIYLSGSSEKFVSISHLCSCTSIILSNYVIVEIAFGKILRNI